MKKSMIWLLAIVLFPTLASSQELSKEYDGFINDKEIIEAITKEASKQFDALNFTGIKELRDQMDRNTAAKVAFLQGKQNKKSHFDFQKQKEGILILAKLYLCDNCPNYHITTASGFVLNKDGVCVTNHHVFQKFDNDPSMYLSVYATDYQGDVFPVKQILAGSEESDLALFKIESEKSIKALKLGNDLNVGDKMYLISHPDKMYYTYSEGYLTRSFIRGKNQMPRQSISADFAKGSSGAPVFDQFGEVVGIVTTTRSVYYRKKEGLQMVVKEIIPVSLLKEMCSSDKMIESDKKGMPGMRP